jgi:hypothetical protein
MTADGQVKLKSAFSTTDKEMDNKLATVKQSLDDSIDEAKKDGSLTWQVVESIFLTEEGLKEDGDQVYRCKSFTTESTTGDVSDGRMRIQVCTCPELHDCEFETGTQVDCRLKHGLRASSAMKTSSDV